MTLLVDTAVVPARERVELWSSASWDAYHPLQIREASERFGGRLWGYELGPLGLFRIQAAANTMSRTPQMIAAADSECLHVSVLLHGRLSLAQQDRTALVGAGDVTSYDTSHPVVARADGPFESLVLSLPRAMLGAHAARLWNLTAVTLPGTRGLPRLAGTFFCGLTDGLEDGSIALDASGRLVECALDLVLGLYADRGGSAGPRTLRSKTELLLHIKAFIEANLGDPDLGPERIARASFISTRYLHKLFEAEGLTVCEWIRAARLERCRRDLLDPALRDRTILEIASRWGLESPPHFSRLFRSAYGCSPSELRRDH